MVYRNVCFIWIFKTLLGEHLKIKQLDAGWFVQEVKLSSRNIINWAYKLKQKRSLLYKKLLVLFLIKYFKEKSNHIYLFLCESHTYYIRCDKSSINMTARLFLSYRLPCFTNINHSVPEHSLRSMTNVDEGLNFKSMFGAHWAILIL